MRTISGFTVAFLLLTICAHSQSSIDSILNQISKNNKEIASQSSYVESIRWNSKVGLSPSNPQIEYDYLIGKPESLGNQVEFIAQQSLDFPTSYIHKKRLADNQIQQAEFRFSLVRQEVLLKSKLVCIEIIYRNNLHNQLQYRLQNLEAMTRAIQQKLDTGSGNVLELNRAKIQIIRVKSLFETNDAERAYLNRELASLNGGNTILLVDTIFSNVAPYFDLNELHHELITQDLVQKILGQDILIGKASLNLSKSQSLPRFQVGYRYQGLEEQQFNGVHFGVSVPLWENRNKIRADRAEVIYHESVLEGYLSGRKIQVEAEFEKTQKHRALLMELSSIFNGLNSLELLYKSWSVGHITSVDYFLEVEYYYDAYSNLLSTEFEYQKAIATLLKYKL